MTLPLFPRRTGTPSLPGQGWNVKWTPTFFNQSFKAANGANIDIALAAYPLHQFELTYDVLRDGTVDNDWGTSSSIPFEWRRLMGFYMLVGGQAGRFLYFNEDDNAVTGQSLLPALGDGTTTVFTVVRSFGDISGGAFLTEPVGQVRSINVFDNGSPVSPTLSTAIPGANTVTFGTPPMAGHAITADITYYYYCKFLEDAVTFEKFMAGRWLASSVKFMSCRAGA